jgi:hypothetical protein
MYRRYRSQREKIAFSFDSFLDVVTNIIGIIIRLILVTWVGARAYHSSMKWLDNAPDAPPDPPALTAPRPEDDPLHANIEAMQKELAAGRMRLAQEIEKLGLLEQQAKVAPAKVNELAKQHTLLAEEQARFDALAGERGKGIQQAAALQMDELRRRSEALREEIKALESLPPKRKTLRYKTPVSRAVSAGEVHFEVKAGKVTHVDLPAFFHEIKTNLESFGNDLKTQFQIQRTTRAIGAFRVNFQLVRSRSSAEQMRGVENPLDDEYFGYFLSVGEVEPVLAARGETLEKALDPNSEFRQIVDSLDNVTAVTFWVYPDSFAAFRSLRDYVHGRGMEVASWPLPEDGAIRFGRYGSSSRGQ